MKYTAAAAAAFAGLAAAQVDIPECAVTCLTDAVTKLGCSGIEDASCMCTEENLIALTSDFDLVSCLTSSCSGDEIAAASTAGLDACTALLTGETTEETEDTTDEVEETIEDTTEDVEDTTEETAEDVEDTTEETAEDVEETTEDTTEDVEDTTEETTEDAEETVEDTTEDEETTEEDDTTEDDDDTTEDDDDTTEDDDDTTEDDEDPDSGASATKAFAGVAAFVAALVVL